MFKARQILRSNGTTPTASQKAGGIFRSCCKQLTVLALRCWWGNCHKPIENHNVTNGQILFQAVRNASGIALKTLGAFPCLPQPHWVTRFCPGRLALYPALLLPMDGAVTTPQPPADLICIYTRLGRMNPAHVLIISADMMIRFYPCQHHKSNTALEPQSPLPQAPAAQMCQQVSNLGAFIAQDGAGEAAQLDSLANVCSALWRLQSAV